MEDIKNTLASWASGVAVVATRLEDLVYGLTVSSFTSVSLDPPLILVCLANGNRLPSMIDRAGAFSVSMLAADQVAVSQYFARPGREPASRFDGINTFSARNGLPIVADSVGFLSCELNSRFPEGDHSIVVGRIVEASVSDESSPLVYCRRGYRELAPAPLFPRVVRNVQEACLTH